MTLVVAASPTPILQFFSDDGTFLVGGQLFTSVGGVPYPTYADPLGLVQHANPIILNNRGEIATSSGQSAQLYLIPNVTYTFALFDAQSNPIDTPTNIQGIPNSATIEQLITSEFIGEVLYPQTPVEAAQSVAPTIFVPTLRIDPMRYGAAGDGFTDDTIALQTALNIAQANNGSVWLGDNRNFLCGALALTVSGNHTTSGLRIEGASANGSLITQNGAMTALLTYNGIDPTGNPQESPAIFANFSLVCNSPSTDGIYLNGVSDVRVDNVFVGFGNRAIYANSCLASVIQNCWLYSCVYGLYARANGTGAPPNLLRVEKNIINGMTVYGVDFNDGSELQMIGNDMEANGDPAGNINSGAIHIGSNINCAPTFGFAKVWLQNNWIENTLGGGYAISVDAPTAGQATWISIRGGHTIASSGGNAIGVAGASYLLIEDHFSGTPGDSWNLTATNASLRNVQVDTLLDTGITYPTYVNVRTGTSGSTDLNGRRDNFTGALTGCTTGPTANVAVYQQGNAITLEFLTVLTATSNTNACTITGLPAKYWPASDTIGVMMVTDNGTDAARPCLVSASTGVITLGAGFTFTTSGVKGLKGGSLPYRRT